MYIPVLLPESGSPEFVLFACARDGNGIDAHVHRAEFHLGRREVQRRCRHFVPRDRLAGVSRFPAHNGAHIRCGGLFGLYDRGIVADAGDPVDMLQRVRVVLLVGGILGRAVVLPYDVALQVADREIGAAPRTFGSLDEFADVGIAAVMLCI